MKRFSVQRQRLLYGKKDKEEAPASNDDVQLEILRELQKQNSAGKKEKLAESMAGAVKQTGKASVSTFKKMAIKKRSQKEANKVMFGMPPGFERTYGHKEQYKTKSLIGHQGLDYTFGKPKQRTL